jgi:5-formyltetrahydrofolate cyclo-ligase
LTLGGTNGTKIDLSISEEVLMATESVALVELEQLINQGGWVMVPFVRDMVAYLRLHPDGSVDSLAIRSETDAHAHRISNFDELVWRVDGTVCEVVAYLRGLTALGPAEL